jgi:hypothetical protein
MIFCQSLYNYYYQRGITPILGKGIADLVSLFVTLGLSVLPLCVRRLARANEMYR